MAEQRSGGNKEVGVNREVQGCYSKGTQGIESWVLCVRQHQSDLALCCFDIASQKAFLGQVNAAQIRTLLSQFRPVEIVIERDSLSAEVMKMLKHQPNNPTMTVFNSERALSLPKIIESIDSVDLKTPALLEIRNNADKELQLRAFGMMVWFLNQCLLENNVKFLKVKGIPDPRTH